MKTPIIPRLALRALNETRRVDLLSYLSLRYSLNSTSSFKNIWAQRIAPEIVRRKFRQTFLENMQFKQLDGYGKPEFRETRRPGGPEILAEVALLDACAKVGGAFAPPETVYSYNLPKAHAIDGAYVPYFTLFTARQNDIGKACRKKRNHYVLYADIKRFYPSITFSRAFKAWQSACAISRLAPEWQSLGHLLLKRQYNVKKGLLIGPLFSHLIANLVLRQVDAKMGKAFPGRYFRYVDDFAIVVPFRKKRDAIARLRAVLKPLRLRLHPKKLHWMEAQDWLENAPYQQDDYDDDDANGDARWKRFIDHLKCYLMARPRMLQRVRAAFLAADLRVPLPRYTAETWTRSYGDRFNERLRSVGFVARLKQISPRELLKEGLALQGHYERQFGEMWGSFVESKGLIRRWKLSKVRYLLGRLLMVGSMDKVKLFHGTILKEPEVAEYAAMFSALVDRKVDSLLPYGWKIAAPVGQVLAAAGILVTSKSTGWKDEHIESYTTLLLTGVEVDAKIPKRLHDDPRIRVVVGHESADAWAKLPCSFFRELSALTAGKRLQNHQEILQTPADPDERWEVFADELLGLEPT